MVAALWRFWMVRGLLEVGRPRFERALSRCPSDEEHAEALVLALNVAGNMAYADANYSASIRHHERSLSIARRLKDASSISASLNNLGLSYMRTGEFTRARACCEDALGVSRLAKDQGMVGLLLGTLGLIAIAEASYDLAIQLLQDCVAEFRAVGNRQAVANNLRHLCRALVKKGDVAAASQCAVEAIGLARELDARPILFGTLTAVAEIAIARSQFEEAAIILTAPNSLLVSLGSSSSPGDAALRAELGVIIEQYLDEASIRVTRQRGEAMNLDDLLTTALDLLDPKLGKHESERAPTVRRMPSP
jgi:hypothetical protein